MTKKKTKATRCREIVEAYSKVHGVSSVNLNKVSEWAIGCGLYPVPTIHSPPAEIESWDRSLAAAQASEPPQPAGVGGR